MSLANAEPLAVKVKMRSKVLNMINSLTFGDYIQSFIVVFILEAF